MKTLAITFVGRLHTSANGGISPGGAIFPLSTIEQQDRETNTLYLARPNRFTMMRDGIHIYFKECEIFVRNRNIREIKIGF